jgi:hypothetical protein
VHAAEQKKLENDACVAFIDLRKCRYPNSIIQIIVDIPLQVGGKAVM